MWDRMWSVAKYMMQSQLERQMDHLTTAPFSVLLRKWAMVVSVQEEVVHVDLPAFGTEIGCFCRGIGIGLVEAHVISPSSVEDVDAILS